MIENVPNISNISSILLQYSLLLVPALIGVASGVVAAKLLGKPTRWLRVAGVGGLGLALTLATLSAGVLGVESELFHISSDDMLNLSSLELPDAPSTLLRALDVTASAALGGVFASGTYTVLAALAIFESPETFSAPVKLIDDRNDAFVDGQMTVEAIPTDRDSDPRRRTIVDGSGRINLPKETDWELTAVDYESTGVAVSPADPSARLTISFPTVTIGVYEERDNSGEEQPVAGATVTLKADRTINEQTTNTDGLARFDPPRSVSSGQVTIEHKRYQSETVTFDTITNTTSEAVPFSPRTGRFQLRSSIDGVRIGGMGGRREAADQFLNRRMDTPVTMSTNADGEVTEDLIIGTYRIELLPTNDRSYFEGEEAEFVVAEDETVTVDLDASFTWPGASDQERSSLIRSEIQQLSDYSGRDGSIPAYYGSVVDAALEAIDDDLPESGHLFFDAPVDPEEVANEMFDAADEAVDAINEAMTTKRNIDLFAACSDMDPAAAEWTGRYSVDDLFEWFDGDLQRQRGEIQRQFERRNTAVKETVESHRQEYAELEPVRAMLEQVEALVAGNRNDVGVIVTTYLALQLLDAIESLFEHDDLCRRLSRTVF